MWFLAVPVPEAIKRAQMMGDFEEARRRIDQFLTRPTVPEPVRLRLGFEGHRMDVLKHDYSYSEEEAQQKFFQSVNDSTPEEYDSLIAEGLLDSMVIDGKRRFAKRFVENLGFASEAHKNRMKEKDPFEIEGDKLRQEHLERLARSEWPKRYRVQGEVRLRLTDDQVSGQTLRCWLPLPREGDQQIRVRLLSASQPSYAVNPMFSEARSVYMEAPKSNDSIFWIRFQYLIREWISQIDPLKIIPPRNPMDSFLQEEAPHIVFTPYLKFLAHRIVGSESNPYWKAKAIYEWITHHIRYSFMNPYIVYEDLSTFAAVEGRGDCGVMALLFITLCRIAGVPARWQSGWYANPIHCGNHDWALFWVEPYGWLPVDASFGRRFRNEPIYHSFYFGNLDAFRMVSTASFMAPLSPTKRFIRNDPYDHQAGEMETEDAAIRSHQLESTIRILAFEEDQEIV